jgi:hypothetical protein
MMGVNAIIKEVMRRFDENGIREPLSKCYVSFNEKRKWFIKKQFLIFLFVIIASSYSCKKNVICPTANSTITNNKMISSLATGNLLYYENADGNWFDNSYSKLQLAASYSITTSTIKYFSGVRSVRFELRDSDAQVESGTRAELTFPIATNNNRWYSYALFFPGLEYKVDATDEVITQWHQGGGVTPALCLRTKADHLFLRILGETWIDLGQLDKDRWHSYVMHIKHSAASDGLIEVWCDGKKIMNRTGPNAYPVNSTYHLPFWKIGIYKSYWNGSQTSSTNKRVLYFDEIRLGNENATYADMLPTGNIIIPDVVKDTLSSTAPSTGNIVTDFILVNAATEKDVLVIKDGQVINLGTLGLNKVNIRVKTTTTGSVKIQLSGQQSKTFIDSKAPYALHGDDGQGNFYYGNWNPPAAGTYSLIATPYQSDNAGGSSGTPKAITFTIKQ